MTEPRETASSSPMERGIIGAVAVIGVPIGVHGSTNLLRVIDLPEPAQAN